LHLLQEKQYKELKVEHDLQKKEKDQDKKNLEAQISKMTEINKMERKKIEDEAWDQIDDIKDTNKEELVGIIAQGMESKTRLTTIQGNFKKEKNEKEKLSTDIKDRQTKLNELVSTYNELKAQIQSQMLELSERESTIRDKDKRITNLKKKTQELEKFKFVLDYKIKELKRDIGPRGATIEKLKEQTNKMQQEQLHFRRVFENLGLIVADLKMRMSGLKRELQKLMQSLEKQSDEMKFFKDQVHDSLNNIGDYKKLKKSIIKLYKLYVTEEVKNKKNDDNDGTLEF